jgi:hypothetical protein
MYGFTKVLYAVTTVLCAVHHGISTPWCLNTMVLTEPAGTVSQYFPESIWSPLDSIWTLVTLPKIYVCLERTIYGTCLGLRVGFRLGLGFRFRLGCSRNLVCGCGFRGFRVSLGVLNIVCV